MFLHIPQTYIKQICVEGVKRVVTKTILIIKYNSQLHIMEWGKGDVWCRVGGRNKRDSDDL